jgi:hypothetical protein
VARLRQEILPRRRLTICVDPVDVIGGAAIQARREVDRVAEPALH